MKNLTDKQQAILNYIKLELATRGYAPTLQEIADTFNTHPSYISKQLQSIQKKGYIHITPKKARSIVIIH